MHLLPCQISLTKTQLTKTLEITYYQGLTLHLEFDLIILKRYKVQLGLIFENILLGYHTIKQCSYNKDKTRKMKEILEFPLSNH